eukprot:2736436-Rhodomonas_salina.1
MNERHAWRSRLVKRCPTLGHWLLMHNGDGGEEGEGGRGKGVRVVACSFFPNINPDPSTTTLDPRPETRDPRPTLDPRP